MANKATSSKESSKKVGATLKEKRAAKQVKSVEQTAARKAWEK